MSATSPASERVLFVDDEQNVLDGIQRSLRKHITLQTATSGADGGRYGGGGGAGGSSAGVGGIPGGKGADGIIVIRYVPR